MAAVDSHRSQLQYEKEPNTRQMDVKFVKYSTGKGRTFRYTEILFYKALLGKAVKETPIQLGENLARQCELNAQLDLDNAKAQDADLGGI